MRSNRSFVIAVFAFMVLVAQSTFATVFEQDTRYIYQITPWTQALESSGKMPLILKSSLTVAKNYVQTLVEDGTIPKDIISLKEMREMDLANGQVEVAVKELNSWINRQKGEAEFLRMATVLPDALMVYIGGKVSGNIGFGAGGSIVLGVVVLPVWIVRIDKVTNETIEYYSAKTSLVAWGSADAGTGLGGGGATRLGVGLIWGSDFFTNPAQYVGFGLGTSLGASLGVGLNLKAGIVSNPRLPGYIDFMYASAAWEIGATATAELHFNGTVVLPLSKLMEIFDTATSSVMSRQEKLIAEQIEAQMRKEMGLPDKPNDNDWDFGKPGMDFGKWE